MRYWTGMVLGQPVSKANQRQAVPRRTKAGKPFTAFIKSRAALEYEMTVARQVPMLRDMLQGELRFVCRIFYAWRGPDLDESLILDCLQGRIYANDRQIIEKHVYKGLDPANPRAIIRVEEIVALALPASNLATGAIEPALAGR